MPTCLISAFLLGTSASQVIAADNLYEECPILAPESVCQPYPKTMEQHTQKGAVSLGRGKGKTSDKRIIQSPMLSLYKYHVRVYNTVLPFYFSITAL